MSDKNNGDHHHAPTDAGVPSARTQHQTRSAPLRSKVCMITVIPFQLNVFLAEHALATKSNADVVLISGGSSSELRPDLQTGLRFHQISIVRPIRPWRDLVALMQIARILRAERPDIVLTLAPKAGLLGMAASFACRVPVRVHWFTGQVWAVSEGIRRWILKAADRLIAALSTDPLADSVSQREFLVNEGIAPPGKISVLGEGSVRGVDANRFRPNAAARTEVRESLGIPQDHTVLIFVGRITRDKGLLELAQALRRLRPEVRELHAILIGFEEGDFGSELLAEVGEAKDRIHLVGYSDAPERFYAAGDFMVLPSHREGFGASVIEAAACGLPAIGTRIVGLIDAIVDGETGILVPARDPASLMDAIRVLARDQATRSRMGQAARNRAITSFRTTVLTEALQQHHAKALARRVPPTLGPGGRRKANRLLDTLLAGFALIVTSPLMAVLAVSVAMTSEGPVIHSTPRVGRHGRIFQMPKFRTMKVGTPQVATDKLADPASRLTPVGGVLRKLSLDELPQLWSVIKGDMSLVGPRPALFNQHELIAARKARGIDALRPGITGWAQINGRDDIPEWRKVELDEEYLRRQSFWFDLQILWLTAWRVVRRDGVSH